METKFHLNKLEMNFIKHIAYVLIFALIGCGNGNDAAKQSGRYYLNSLSGNDQNEGSSPDAPWKTMKPMGEVNLKPGDSVFFAKGSKFIGTTTINNSGEENAPIVLTTYGQGSVPSFSNPDFSVKFGNVFQLKGSYIVVDGLLFENCANSPSKENKEILSVGAVYGFTGADHLTVKNCEFIDCPIGIYIKGQHCLITNNKIHDCNRFLSEPDWGPIGVLIGNAYNEVSFNQCTNYVKVGGNYGADGGFIELDDRYFGNKVHDVSIHHNISKANQGFLEVESQVTGDSLNVYYNFSDDYQQFIFYWGGNNSKVENNTVIRTRPSNHGAVNTVFTMRNGNFTLRNNIFVVANGIQVLVTAPYEVGNYAKVVHENNLYYCADESTTDPCGITLGSDEKIADPNFVSLSAGDYHLSDESPAIKAGKVLGYTLDLDNNPLPENALPDIGAYERQEKSF